MSASYSLRVLAELGLDDDIAIEPVAEWRVDDARVASFRGFARETPEPEPNLAEQIRAHPNAIEAPVEGLEDVQISFWERDPTVVLVEREASSVFATFPLEPLEDELFVGRLKAGLPEGLLLEGARGRVLVQVTPGEVRVGRLPELETRAPSALAPVALEAPDFEVLLGDERLDPSLSSLARAYAATGEPYAVGAAVAVVTGLWRPAPRAGLDAILGVSEWPEARGARWIEGLEGAALAELLDGAHEECDRLAQGLEEVSEGVAAQRDEDLGAARAIAQAWLRDRQVLAEVRRLLGGHGSALDAPLARLDALTLGWAEPFLALDELSDDDLLSVASPKDPDAPWIRLATS